MRRLTIEYVKKYISKAGYTCLSDRYTNNKVKLEILCDKGHQYQATFNKFTDGERCPECAKSQRKYTPAEQRKLDLYKKRVRLQTDYTYDRYKNVINPEDLSRSEYQLDHIYSVLDGFDNNVPIRVLCSPINLMMLPMSDNISKGRESGMTIEELNDK